MKQWSLEEQKKRIENIRYANEHVKSYSKHIRVHDYLPGQVTYNLGPYPAKFPIEPTEYDYNLIKSFAEKGVGLIQVHEEWNDHIRLYGGDKYTSHDPEGMKKFIELCHSFGIKVLPYLSSFYLYCSIIYAILSNAAVLIADAMAPCGSCGGSPS